MKNKDFEFLNSSLWIKYTQEKYLPLEDIKYRLDRVKKLDKKSWPKLRNQITWFRKVAGVPLFLKEIDTKFWYFPSDIIHKKISKIETLGNHLFDRIKNQGDFRNVFLSDTLMEESIASSIYEGANTTRSQAKTIISSNQKPRNKDEWMLVNNYKAMQWIKKNSKAFISHELILKIHEIVTKNTLPANETYLSGQFRDQAVYVGTHQGIDHKKIKKCFTEVVHLITKHPRFLHGLIKGICFHYFTAFIHPFFDGNGRTARTLFYFESIKNNLKFVELLSISANLKNHGKRYERSFELTKKYDYDITYFIDFCLDSLLIALKNVENKVNYLISFSFLKKDIKGITLSQIALLQRMALYKHKPITIEEHAKYIKKSREMARKDLKFLLQKNLLKENKVGKKYVYFIQNKILKEKILALKHSRNKTIYY